MLLERKLQLSYYSPPSQYRRSWDRRKTGGIPKPAVWGGSITLNKNMRQFEVAHEI